MVLAFPPVDLLADALEDGWDAPSVRTQLLDAFARQLIQRPWPTNTDERLQVLSKMIAADRRFPDYEQSA
ncbi:hypothetical protein [Nonomuraea sp. NPDC003754]